MNNKTPDDAVNLQCQFEHDGHDITMVLPSVEDHISSKIRNGKTFYECEYLDALRSLLDEGDLVVDAGANIGNHTVYFARIAGCHVHAFEPMASTFDILKKNIEANKIEGKVSLHLCALGKKQAHAEVAAFDPANIGGTTLRIRARGAIAVETLDSQKFPARVCLIKVDAEGMDADVILGAKKLIRHDRPVVACEAANATQYAHLQQIMSGLGYVSVACYNATDTYIFLPAVDDFERDALVRYGFSEIISLQRDARAIWARFAQAGRYAERVAREAGEKAGQEIKDLAGQMKIIEKDLAGKQASELAELKAQAQAMQEASTSRLDEVGHSLDALQERAEKGQQVLASTMAEQGQKQASELAELKAQAQAMQEASTSRLDEVGHSLDALQERAEKGQQVLASTMAEQGQKQATELAELKAQTQTMQETNTTRLDEVGRSVEILKYNLLEGQRGLKRMLNNMDKMDQLRDKLFALEQTSSSRELQLLQVKTIMARKQELMAALEDRLLEKDQAHKAALIKEGTLREELKGMSRREAALAKGLIEATSAAKANGLIASDALQQNQQLSRSITFQLGSALFSAMHSVGGLMRFPAHLGRVRRESRRRKHLDNPGDASQWQVVVPLHLSGRGDVAAAPMALAPPRSEAMVVAQPPRLPEQPSVIGKTRMAVIMDEFTHASYAPCCDVLRLRPDVGVAQLEAFRPHVLFVESAWQGEDGEWQRKVPHAVPELIRLIHWCREHRVPTVFWNKEDPVHFETFMGTARWFDYVFTTGIDCIARYKSLLGHDRVYLLPFACQPRSHNPIEAYERKDGACFAGAYYVRYPERQRDFDTIIQTLEDMGEVDIFDRNYGKDDVNYMFPEAYQPLIKGSLAFKDIGIAYKGYRFGINLNSVKQSQTMFARRAFDLLGSNTVTISNYSRGLRLLFGDLVLSTDNGPELRRRLSSLWDSEHAVNYRKFRLLGLRKVLSEHTYDDRLAYILTKVFGQRYAKPMPQVHVVARVANAEKAERVLRAFRRQAYDHKHLHLVLTEGMGPLPTVNGPDVSVLASSAAEAIMPKAAWEGHWLAALSSADYYGPNYLTDLALATLYCDASILGKACHYQADVDSVPQLLHEGRQYHYAEAIAPRRCLMHSRIIEGNLLAWSQSVDDAKAVDAPAFVIDEFNYLADAPIDTCAEVDDLTGVDAGLSLATLIDNAESIPAQRQEPAPGVRVLGPDWMLDNLPLNANDGKVSLRQEGAHLVLDSHLTKGEHAYLYAEALQSLDGWMTDDQISFHLDVELGLLLQPVVIFFNAQKERIGHVIKHACRNVTVPVPEGAVSARLGLRVEKAGKVRLDRWVLGKLPWASSRQLNHSDVLLLTNVYPSYDELYRNGFVHRRIKGYEERGLKPEVFCLRNVPGRSYREFEGIDVTTGWKDALRDKLRSNKLGCILVHFLDSDMWDVLKDFLPDTRILVWVHGSEIQHWRQREFNYANDEEREKAIAASDLRMEFWRGITAQRHPNLHFIFVSKWFERSAMEDVGVELDSWQYSIIHNVIDEKLFQYHEKDVGQRWKMLSIRPYASRKYANDLTVKAILALKNTPEFERMEFRLVGDGPLFEETLAPVADLPNVTIERCFLSQQDIAALHKEYGVFLSPTRMDAQGVSRDEAMSSGLVPLTNAVTAIPEFVDDKCGLLAPGEDHESMAAKLLDLVQSPEKFRRLSVASAARVRRQCGASKTLDLEADLIFLRTGSAADGKIHN